MVAAFMLVGIVLSNAYKNSNVYNMIAPRSSIPFTHLKALVENNFTIYVRSSSVFMLWNSGRVPTWTNVNVIPHFISAGRSNSVKVYSEVGSFSIDMGELYIKYQNNNKSIQQMDNYESVTDMHPNLHLILKKRVEEIQAMRPVPYKMTPELERNITGLFWNEEDKLLSDFIDNCDKAALVLPQWLCLNHARRLRRLKLENVYVGEERLASPMLTFALSNQIPPFVVKRLSGTTEGGLWDRWQKLIQGSYSLAADQSREVLRKPSLDGNVVVIFVVLMAGLGLAVFCFILENWKVWGNWGKRLTYYRVSPFKSTPKNLSFQDYIREQDTLDSTQTQRIPLTNNDFPSILNLNEILAPFVSPNCIVNLNNFRDIDVFSGDPPNYPLILWTPVLGIVEKPWRSVSWMPKGFYKNGNVSWLKDHLQCNTSNLLRLYEWKYYGSGVCLGMDSVQYSSRSKPWNCNVEIYLYHPNVNNTMNYGYPENLQPNVHDKYVFRNSFAYYRIPSVKLFVGHASLQFLDSNMLSTWMDHVIVRNSDQQPTNVLCLFATVTSKSNYHGVIRSVETMTNRIKYFTKDNATVIASNSYRNYVTFRLVNISNISFEDLSELSYPDPRDILRWHVKTLYKTYKPTESVNYQLASCNKTLVHMKHFLSLPSHLSQMEKLAKTYAHVWLSIMGNVTFTTTLTPKPNIVCYPLSGEQKMEKASYHSIEISDEIFINTTLLGRAAHIPLHMSVLKFVSCGRPQLQSIGFEELINVFDSYVWLFSIISMLLLLFAMVRLSQKRHQVLFNIKQYSLALLKVIVEQGDPFPKEPLVATPTRLMVAAFMLVGIVLSNAYKNSNVYNMIAPRSPVPYTHLKALVENNFTIYVRSSSVDYFWWYGRFPTWTEVNIALHHISVGEVGSVDVHSEIAILIELMGAISNIYQYSNISKLKLKEIESVTAMHPNLYLIVKKQIKEIQAMKQVPSEITSEVELELGGNFWRDEDKLLSEFIDKCDKAALILPQSLCLNHAKRLRRLKLENVYIGEEKLARPMLVFSLANQMPPFVVKRLNGATEAGLWDRWQTLIQGSYSLAADQSRELLRKPSLDGNVLVIFVVLMTGLSFSVFCFILESWRGVGQVICAILMFPWIFLAMLRLRFKQVTTRNVFELITR
ncbi:unnamed protein product [Orchesella dallaii]|uniref:Uncharacterized protein n=1 Tax=Orchesella dallaii TaxID=48710 RepID=A0ABP1R8E9_9HEXA